VRIGVRVTEGHLVGVFVREDGSYGMHTVPARKSDAMETLLVGLGRYASDPAWTSSEVINSICFDVSDVLVRQELIPVTVIRIAPRPPIDLEHELRDEHSGSPRIVHIAGGQTTLGEAIVPLDAEALRKAASEAPRGGRYVITGVGSLVNPAQEIEAGQILLDHAEPVSVGYSHSFYSSSFAVRERTAVINSSLVPFAESLATTLSLNAGAKVPQARLYVTTNDGGRVPLSRLPITPVHSMFASHASELMGAAALSNLNDGGLVITRTRGSVYGEMHAGVPAVVPQRLYRGSEKLATQSANLLPATELLVSGLSERPAVVAAGSANREVPRLGLEPGRRADVDLSALGAARAPLAEWVNRVVIVGNASEMEQALAVSEARVKARLVSFGAIPSRVRILESRAVATTYENPRVVSVRVRAVAMDADVGALLGGELSASQQ
jgi:hypothetical protein